ncbi:MAG: YceI family protein [Sphingomonas bacterium]
MDELQDEAAPPLGTNPRYSRVAMLLHWLIAACFAFQIGLGLRMDAPRGPQTFAVYQLHKSVGITILLLTLIRLAWRLTKPAPAFPATMSALEKRLANIVHAGFYILLIGLPLTGWLIVSTSKTAVPTFLYGVLPWPHVPGIPALAPSAKAFVNDLSGLGHESLVYIAYLLLALHIAGALKHQFVERGDDLARMLPAPRRMLGAAAVAVIAAFALILATGNLIHLAPIALAGVSSAPAPTPAVEVPSQATPVAPPTAPATPEATPTPEATHAAVADTWIVRPSASSLRFHTAWSQGPVDGRFGKWKAVVLFGPEALDSSSVEVTIDMASATTGVSDTESALPGTDWFSVATHPTATFKATRFRHLAGNRYEALGTLSLRGVSRSLKLPFTLSIADDVATVTGTATIDRTLFGVGQGEWAATTDVPAAVTVTVSIKADRKS